MNKLEIAQLENNYYEGYTIDSFFYKLIIAEVLGRELTPNEFLLMVYITNQTIGHRDPISGEPKMWDYISQSNFQRILNANETPTNRDLKSLEEKSLINVHRDNSKRRDHSTAKFNAYRIGEELFDVVYELYCELTGGE